MAELASRLHPQSLIGTSHLVAADVGGTHARVGLVEVGADGSRTIHDFRKYVCADYPGLANVLSEFIAGIEREHIAHVAVALPGYVLDGVVVNTNLPWQVSVAQLRQELGLHSVSVVNDFEAVAHAIPSIKPSERTIVSTGEGGGIGGRQLVVGPGTGLGAAIRVPDHDRTLVLATEAGQAAFAPTTELEIEILRLLRRKSSHVSIEQVVSGPGLMNLYAALCALRGEAPSLSEPVQISRAALDDAKSAAAQALHAFCGLLGSVVGDLVLTLGAQGGAWLAGGILPQLREFLLRSDFRQRFLDKGAMRPVLERVPVYLIEHGQLGVLGAANWHLDHQHDGG